jgi:hypothetical protein
MHAQKGTKTLMVIEDNADFLVDVSGL